VNFSGTQNILSPQIIIKVKVKFLLFRKFRGNLIGEKIIEHLSPHQILSPIATSKI
jgi:hypothetical protein